MLEADRERDPVTREMLREEGALLADRWRCPSRGYPHAQDRGELDPECVEVLESVGRLTGATECTTCPLVYTRLPWVARAVEAFEWRKHGSLQLIEQPVTQVLADAIGAVRDGLAKREMYDVEQMRVANERAAEAQKKGAGHG